MSLINEYLRSPSAYEGNWWGHVRNRMLHTWLVGGVFGFALHWYLGLWGTALLLLIYAAAIEYPQWKNYNAQLWDSVEDFGDVLAGALTAAGYWPAGVVQSVFFLSSALRRR